MNVGDTVKIEKCSQCSSIIGKTAKIVSFTSECGYNAAKLNFGRGRPQLNRPSIINIDDVSLVEEVSNGSV